MANFQLFKKQPKKTDVNKTSVQEDSSIKVKKQVKEGDNKNKSIKFVSAKPASVALAPSKFNVLKRPLLTEKATNLKGLNKFVFEVDPKASKGSIKQAIQEFYHVKVENIRVINFPAKQRRWGRKYSTFRNRKKAVVTLKTGDKIEVGI